MSWPCRVVVDRPDLVALFIPRGATYMRWVAAGDGSRRLEPGAWRRDVLRLMFPETPFSVWLFWEHGQGGRRFSSYYINMEEPFRRSPVGFDTNDHALDIVVAPDFSWRWKDEDELSARVRDGIYSEPFAAEVRSAALAVLGLVERRASPFADGWETWEPDPAWEVPVLPDTWASAPVILWPRRTWAYLDA
jgi:hypothetical protein